MLTVVTLIPAWHSPVIRLRRLATAPMTSQHLRARLIALAEIADVDWDDVEDEALLVSVPAFTVGEGTGAVTFWPALAASSPLLARRPNSNYVGSSDVNPSDINAMFEKFLCQHVNTVINLAEIR